MQTKTDQIMLKALHAKLVGTSSFSPLLPYLASLLAFHTFYISVSASIQLKHITSNKHFSKGILPKTNFNTSRSTKVTFLMPRPPFFTALQLKPNQTPPTYCLQLFPPSNRLNSAPIYHTCSASNLSLFLLTQSPPLHPINLSNNLFLLFWEGGNLKVLSS